MSCSVCHSTHQCQFPAEMNIHFPGVEGLSKRTVLAFPELLVCLECGSTELTLMPDEVQKLVDGTDRAGEDQATVA